MPVRQSFKGIREAKHLRQAFRRNDESTAEMKRALKHRRERSLRQRNDESFHRLFAKQKTPIQRNPFRIEIIRLATLKDYFRNIGNPRPRAVRDNWF